MEHRHQPVPEWMQKTEDYTPLKDSDRFIDKTIMGFLSLIGKIKTQSGYRTDRFNVDSVWKVLFTFLLILMLSLSRNFVFVEISLVYLFVLLSLLKGSEIIRILKIGTIMTVFTFVILLPAAFSGNWYSSIMITVKVFATILSINILSFSSQWASITGALKRFYVPDLFILVMDITMKYISMLGEFSLEMFYALKLRSVGKNLKKYHSVGGIVGTLFIKSTEMAEDMYGAMQCRGFTGEYKVHRGLHFGISDGIYFVLNGLIIAVFIYLGGTR